MGEHLGVSFAESNPRKTLKKAKKPLGHLPLEIMNYLSAYVENLIQIGSLKTPTMQTIASM
jgi:putative membrane protein